MEKNDRPLEASPGEPVSAAPEGAAQRASEQAQEVKDRVLEGAQAARENAQSMASDAGKAARDAAQRVGERAGHLAETVREKGPSGNATGAVADAIEGAGRYLQDGNFQDMAEDLTKVIRRYPVQSVLVGIGIGYLLARTTER